MKNKMKHIATAAALGVVALLASCVSRQVAVEAESRSDSLELVVSAKDSLINAVFADINAISENLALIKSRENLITVAGESEGGRRPVEEIDNDIKAIDRLLRENNEKMRQDFTANVSHELKTPLTSISGYAELIETGIAKPADVPEFGRKIHVEASRMIQLVNDILQLSHLDSVSETHAQPDMETVDLLDVAKDCVERQKLNAQRSFISLTYLGESAKVLGNRDQLDELCQNLCDNAIRYNRPGGKVQLITSCTRDGHCTLTVKDNGIGIPKDAQSSVFERFYRVDKSRSKATGGTGLGLAIVKHIGLLHHARIKLESEVNVGTTITVVFETAH